MFPFLVSVAFSGSQQNVVAVGCLTGNVSEILPSVAIVGPGYNVFLGIESSCEGMRISYKWGQS